jgi:hypothetical protein
MKLSRRCKPFIYILFGGRANETGSVDERPSRLKTELFRHGFVSGTRDLRGTYQY